jgi:hypothetical protein
MGATASQVAAFGVGAYTSEFSWIIVAILSVISFVSWAPVYYWERWHQVEQYGFRYVIRTLLVGAASITVVVALLHELGRALRFVF